MSAIVTFYTGLMGDGKTLKTMHDLIMEMVEDDKRPPDQQTNFYTNIDGLKIQGVLDAPDDWRQVEDNSLVIYDEADMIGNYESSRKSEVNPLVREIKLARKRNIRLWFIVQHPSMINAFIRRIGGRHIHVQRPLGAELTKVWEWSRVQDKPDDFLVQKNAESTYLFKFPKHLYSLYDSVNAGTNHERKFKMPESWIKGIIFVVVLIALASFFAFRNTTDKNEFEDDAVESLPVVEQLPPMATNTNQDELINVLYSDPLPDEDVINNDVIQNPVNSLPVIYKPKAVFKMGDKCKAFNEYNQELQITYDECLKYL